MDTSQQGINTYSEFSVPINYREEANECGSLASHLAVLSDGHNDNFAQRSVQHATEQVSVENTEGQTVSGRGAQQVSSQVENMEEEEQCHSLLGGMFHQIMKTCLRSNSMIQTTSTETL